MGLIYLSKLGKKNKGRKVPNGKLNEMGVHVRRCIGIIWCYMYGRVMLFS